MGYLNNFKKINIIKKGNHSATQYPDITYSYITNYPVIGMKTNVRSLINDDHWIQNEFISIIQQVYIKINR